MPPSARRGLLLVLVVLLLAAAYAARIRTRMADFSVYYRAAERLVAAEPLYQPSDGHFMFKYLPASALIFVPLGVLPVEIARAAWFAISLLALASMFVLVRQLVPPPHAWHLLLLSGLVLAKFFLRELELGQVNLLMTAVLLLATRALSRGEDGRAGALAGVATVLKPYAAVFIPYFLIRRCWAAAASAAGVLIVALLIPALFYGWAGNLQQLQAWGATLTGSTPTLLSNIDNVSLLAFFTKWVGSPARALVPAALVLALLGAMMLVIVLRAQQDRTRTVLECALLLTLVPLASPLGWDYTFLASLLAVALVINAFDVFPRAARIVLAVNFLVIALAVYDIVGRHAYGVFMAWSVTTINFLIVVAAVVYLHVRGTSQPPARAEERPAVRLG